MKPRFIAVATIAALAWPIVAFAEAGEKEPASIDPVFVILTILIPLGLLWFFAHHMRKASRATEQSLGGMNEAIELTKKTLAEQTETNRLLREILQELREGR